MQNRTARKVSISLALSLMAIMIISAFTNPAAATSSTGNTARVRVMHASPDAPAVDVWVNGTRAFSNISFKSISDYAKLQPGTYHVQVVPAGATTPVVIDATLTLAKHTDYTVVAIGKLATIHPLVLVDNNKPVSSKMVRIRFVHASPDAPSVDIAVHNGPVLFSNVAFGQSSGYITVPRGTYPLEVRLAGANTVVLSLGNVKFRGGSTYTAIAVGLVADQSLTAVLHMDSSHHTHHTTESSHDTDNDDRPTMTTHETAEYRVDDQAIEL